MLTTLVGVAGGGEETEEEGEAGRGNEDESEDESDLLKTSRSNSARIDAEIVKSAFSVRR